MMNIGDKALVTTDGWFFAPDGEQYRAVWGTIRGIHDDISTLGIKTNARSTNWYLEIGNTIIAGCQVHYAIKCDSFDPTPPSAELHHNGHSFVDRAGLTRIYNAE